LLPLALERPVALSLVRTRLAKELGLERTEFEHPDTREPWEFLRMTDELADRFRRAAEQKGAAAPFN
jgi:hypothetical protein